MSMSHWDKLYRTIPQGNCTLCFDKCIGIGWIGALIRITNQISDSLYLLGLPSFLIRLSGNATDQLSTLLSKVVVTKPAVILTTCVDHFNNRFVSDCFDRCFYPLSTLPTAARINQKNPWIRYHKTKGSIVTIVFGGAIGQWADNGIGVAGDFYYLQLFCLCHGR